MESERHICVYDSKCAVLLNVTSGESKILFNLKSVPSCENSHIKSVLRHPTLPLMAVHMDALLMLVNSEGTQKTFVPKQPVTFWKWVSPTKLGIVTDAKVYHWSVQARIHDLQIDYAFDAMAREILVSRGLMNRTRPMSGGSGGFPVHSMHIQSVTTMSTQMRSGLHLLAWDVLLKGDYRQKTSQLCNQLNHAMHACCHLHSIVVDARPTQVRGCTILRAAANNQFKLSDDFSQTVPTSAATFFKHDVGDLHMLMTQDVVKMLTPCFSLGHSAEECLKLSLWYCNILRFGIAIS